MPFLMSDAVIQEAINYVNGLSSRQALCNCPSCLLNHDGLVERSLIMRLWVNPDTAKNHAEKHSNHVYTDDPLVYIPDPTKPFKHLTHHQVQQSLETAHARVQALRSSQHSEPSNAEVPSLRQPDSSIAGAGPSSFADSHAQQPPPLHPRTALVLLVQRSQLQSLQALVPQLQCMQWPCRLLCAQKLSACKVRDAHSANPLERQVTNEFVLLS